MSCLSNSFYLFISVTVVTLSTVCMSFAAPVVANGTSVTLNGGEASSNTDNTPAILAINNGFVTSNGANVFSTGNNANGATATNSGQIVFNGSTITTSGTSSFGIYASQGGVITASGPFIRTTGANSAGAVADILGTLILSGPGIETNGINSAGVLALTGGFISGSANVTTNNSNSPAFNAAGGEITYTGGSISTRGDSSPVFCASQSGVLTASGFYAPTYGANSPVAYALSGGSITLSSASLQTFGTGSAGVVASGPSSVINLSSLSLETLGAYSPAFVLSNGGVINMSSASATAKGTNSYGLNVINVGSNAASTLNITDASLRSELFDAMNVDSASVTVNTTRGSISGGSGILLNAKNALVNINGIESADFTGAVLSNNSTVNMSLKDSSTWTVTADSNVTSLMNLSSTITFPEVDDPLDPSSYKKLTTHSYTGIGGVINMNTFLDVSSSPSDRLVIDGGSASGSTTLKITNTGGDGALTFGNGILLVEAINGGTTSESAFTAESIPAGILDYNLFRGGVTRSEANNWYLRTFTLVDAPEAPPEEEIDNIIERIDGPGIPAAEVIASLPPPPPGKRWVPAIRGPVSLHVAIPTTALLINRLMLTDTLHQRVGEEEQLNGRRDVAIVPYLNGFWLRLIGDSGRFGDRSIFNEGPEFDYHFGAIQLGVDLYHSIYNGNQNFAGVYGIAGQGDSDVDNFLGTKAGTNRFRSRALGFYWTYFNARGFYFDAIVDRSLHNIHSDAKDPRAPDISTNGGGLGASLESGYPFMFNHHIGFEPEIQILRTNLSLKTAQGLIPNHFNNCDSVAGRLGARLKTTWNFQPSYNAPPQFVTAWITANAWHEFDGDTTTQFVTKRRAIPFDSSIKGSWADFGIGVSGQVSRTSSLYATVNREIAMSKRNLYGYSGGIGLRVNL